MAPLSNIYRQYFVYRATRGKTIQYSTLVHDIDLSAVDLLIEHPLPPKKLYSSYYVVAILRMVASTLPPPPLEAERGVGRLFRRGAHRVGDGSTTTIIAPMKSTTIPTAAIPTTTRDSNHSNNYDGGQNGKTTSTTTTATLDENNDKNNINNDNCYGEP